MYLLKTKGLSVRYNQKTILSKINFSFLPGNFYLIKGPSGIGKTSLINCLGLLKKPSSGSVFWGEKNLWELSDNDRADFRHSYISFVFQKNNLVENMSVKNNILLPLAKSSDYDSDYAIQKLSEITQLLKIEDLLGKFPKDLSGGEEQRVAIARALISQSKIILADEPTSSLDETNADNIYGFLSKLAHNFGKIVIVVSHESLPSKYADSILEIRNQSLLMVKDDTHSFTKDEEPVTKTSDLTAKQSFSYNSKLNNHISSLSCILSVVVVLLMLLSSCLPALPTILVNKQENSFSAVMDKNIFVVNDIAKVNSPQDLDSYRAFSSKTTSKIKTAFLGAKVYPFINFTSYGITPTNVRTAVPKSYSIYLGNKQRTISNDFSIQPIYPEDLNKKYLYESGKPLKNSKNFVVSQDFLSQNGLSVKSVMNKVITLKAYVPYLLYITETELPNDNTKNISTDGDVYKVVTIKATISGVYKSNYPYHRSEQGNAFFMDYKAMKDIQDKVISKSDVHKRVFKSFSQKAWAPSAYVLAMKNINQLKSAPKKLSSISKDIRTYSTLQNVDNVKQQLEQTKRATYKFTFFIVLLVFLVLYVIFNIIYKQRTYEFGILKCIGFSNKDIFKIIRDRIILCVRMNSSLK